MNKFWVSGWDINYQPSENSVWTVFFTHNNPGKPEAFQVVVKLAYDQLEAERDTAVSQTDRMREACANYPAMVDKLLAERDELKAQLDRAEDIIWTVSQSRDGTEHGNNQYIAKEYFEKNS